MEEKIKKEYEMNIDDILDFLDKNPKLLIKVFINFEEELLAFLHKYYNKYKVVDFISRYYERNQRKIIVKELLNTL